jgi:hypothetical protein
MFSEASNSMKTAYRPFAGYRINLFIYILSLQFLTGCAGPKIALRPAPQPSQTTRLENGKMIIESKKEHLVYVRPLRTEVHAKQRLEFLVMVGNQGSSPFEFSIGDVAVRLDDQFLKTYTFEELQQEIANNAAALAAMGMVYSANASMNASFAQTHINAALAPNASLNYSLNQLNAGMPYAQQADQYSNMANQMQTLSLATSAQAGGLGSILRHTVIPPGAVGGGIVTVDSLKSAEPHTITLTVNPLEETHIFTFTTSIPEPRK